MLVLIYKSWYCDENIGLVEVMESEKRDGTWSSTSGVHKQAAVELEYE